MLVKSFNGFYEIQKFALIQLQQVNIMDFYCLNSSIIGCLFLTLPMIFMIDPCYGQSKIIGDQTLSTSVSNNDNNFEISGGKLEGKNLFHSFQDFSISENNSVIFKTPMPINNIFSRITGKSVSRIDGTLKVGGDANFILINPNGLFFGSNAKLNIGGSFLASTADSILFRDGIVFNSQDTGSLLSMSAPVGLQFGNRAEPIIHESVGDSFSGVVNFKVPANQTLALIGGDISLLNQGALEARGGKIQLGSVTPYSFVGINLLNNDWKFNFNDVSGYKNIKISENSFLNVSNRDFALASGQVSIYGRNIVLQHGSLILAQNEGSMPGGPIVLRADDSLSITDGSNIESVSFSSGKASNIDISAKRIKINSGSSVESVGIGGEGGDILINATEFVELDGIGDSSQLQTQGQEKGNAGDLTIQTKNIFLLNGGRIASATRGFGDAGILNIFSRESIKVEGQGLFFGIFPVPSAITSSTSSGGDGGDILIRTQRLIVDDAAQISASATMGSSGSAGTLKIIAPESVSISGHDTSIQAKSEGAASAGDLNIQTNQLLLYENAQVNLDSTGIGQAGTLEIDANIISLINQAKLSAITQSEEGNIDIQAKTVFLGNKSGITTNSTSNASGGNITINSDFVFGLNNSDITANAAEGLGGNIEIIAKGIYGLTERTLDDLQNQLGSTDSKQLDPSLLPTSDVSAISQSGNSTLQGTVSLQTLDLNKKLADLPVNIVNASQLIANNCTPSNRSSELSEFVITGRTSIANPSEQLNYADSSKSWITTNTQSDLNLISSTLRSQSTTHSIETQFSSQILEAQGWKRASNGKVVLSAELIPHSTKIAAQSNSPCRSS